MKQYPLRPKKYLSGRYNKICECGHEDIDHKVSNQVLMTYPPKYTHLECEECMCPAYKHEKTYTQHLPCN